MPRFPEYAYYSRNYEFKKVILDEKPKYIVFDKADFLNVVSSTADISKVYISINGGDFVKLSGVVPVTTPFSNVVLTWDDSENGKEIDIIVGHELFAPSTQSITIVGDLIGLAKDETVSSIMGSSDITLTDIYNKLGSVNGDVSVSNFPSWVTSSTKTTDDLLNELASILSQLDVALSSRASESTLSGVKSQTDKLTYDANNNLLVDIGADSVGLAKDSTVSGLKGSDGRTLTDIYNKLGSIGGSVSVSNLPTDYPDSGTHDRLDSLKGALASVNTDKLLTTPDNPPNLDIAVSNLYNDLEALKKALSSIGTDKVLVTPDNPPNLDTALSSLYNDLEALKKSLASIGTDKILVTPDNPPNLDTTLSSRASESTLSAINSKIQSQSSGLFVKDVSVGTSATQIDADSTYRHSITILADEGNSDVVYIGDSNNQLFPLKAGASITIRKTALNLIYAKANSGTQTIHVIAGGS